MSGLKHGIQPFWFWNGEMKDEEIRRQIREMKEQGFPGFLIHPRQGMELPYLSEMFFEKVRTAVTAAKELGMEVWLYDEFPYPSGVSGGKVTLEHPEYTCRELKKTCQVYQGGETARLYAPWGKVLMARAYPVIDGACQWEDYKDLTEFTGCGYLQDVFQMSGLTKYNKKRYFQGELSQYLYWQVPEGTWKVYLYTEVVMEHFKYFETFIDPLNPEAVRFFLKTTHEQYKKYVGDEFGKTIKGIFTDEVTAFPPFHPWSPLLPGLVKERFGLELTDYLPALSEDMGEITDQVRYAYWDTSAEQFIESWDKQVYDWCEENHLLYIGEKPILRSEELKYTHVPGIDAGHQKFGSKAVLVQNKYRANGKIVSSAAHFYGKPAALCEAFHSIGWGMDLQDAKWIFDWLTVMGIDWFITHGAYYTTDGLKKHDAPPSFFYQMPWWKHTHLLSDYVESLQKFLLEGKRHVSALLLDPVTSTWTEIDGRLKQLNQEFADFQNALLEAGVDYYVMDPQLFAKGQVSTEDRVFYENCGDRYDILVLPFMTNLESGAVRMLQEYTKAGGTVLAVGTVPFKELESYPYEAWAAEQFQVNPRKIYEAYFQKKTAFSGTWNQNCCFSPNLLWAVEEIRKLEEGKRLWKVSGNGNVLQIQSRGSDGRERLFMVNPDPKTCRVEIQANIQTDDSLDGCTVSRELVGGESLFLELDEQGKILASDVPGRSLAAPYGQWVLEIDTHKEMEMKTWSDNALRIGIWQMTLSDGQSAAADSFPLIDQMEEAGMHIPICQKDYFGCPKELEFPEIQAEYTYRFWNHLKPDTPVTLVMEPGTLLGQWELWVNDKKIGSEDFKERPVYLPSNLAAEVGKALLPGENCLKLRLKSEVSYGGIRNPLYLCGRFSVALTEEGARLEPERSEGCMADLTASGLPYYAGTIEFTREISEEWLEQLPKGETVSVLVRQDDFHDALQLAVGEKEIGTCIYAPYVFQVPAEELKTHKKMHLRMDTTLCRLFEGEVFEEETHAYVKIACGDSEGRSQCGNKESQVRR